MTQILTYRGLTIKSSLHLKNYAVDFLKRVSKKYGKLKYDFSNSIYCGATKKLKIKCNTHGFFHQISNNFFKYGCSYCVRQQKFLKRAINKFQDHYKYPHLVFKGYRKPVSIMCPIHKEIIITPELHLRYGCKKCNQVNLFIKQAKNKFPTKNYDYSKITEVDNKLLLTIICPEHGEFFQRKPVHLNRNCKGCPYCSYEKLAESRRTSKSEFRAKAGKVHGYKYKYDLQEFYGLRSKIIIECREHGLFFQIANNHLNGSGCKICSYIKMADKKRLSTKIWVAKAVSKHKNRFDYSKVIYLGRKRKVKIRCKKHNLWFLQNPHNHLYKPHCCPKCEKEAIQYDKEEFIEKAIRKHGMKYDYSKVKYFGAFVKVEIYCKDHKEFFQTPGNHLYGTGCPGCRESHGEARIKIYLDKGNIKYEINKTFKELVHKKPLKFDFYLKEKNLLIEFDGEQHYSPVKHFGGMHAFRLLVKRDKLKTEYAKKEKINLLRIKYLDFEEIENILNRFFKTKQ